MKVGDKVRRVPVTFGEYEEERDEKRRHKTAMNGTVVYIHPKGRYHTVEFETKNGAVRECFLGAGD